MTEIREVKPSTLTQGNLASPLTLVSSGVTVATIVSPENPDDDAKPIQHGH